MPCLLAHSALKEYAQCSKEKAERSAGRMKAERYQRGTQSRLHHAVVDMQTLLESKDCGYLGDCEEVVAARTIVKEAQAALAAHTGQ